MSLTVSSTRRELDLAEKCQLADALGNNPETALAVHALRKGHGQVYMTGELPHFRAVIVEDYDVGPELLGFGDDPQAFVEMVSEIREWEALDVPMACGEQVARLLRERLNLPNHIVDDIYQVPGRPVQVVPHPEVRMLTQDDIPLLDATPDDIRDSFEDDLAMVLREERIAGAFADGRIVSVGCTYGFCEPYVDVAISTLAEYRGRGYARAAASLVAAAVQAAGGVPIWSCAPTNTPSLAVAAKLGFCEWSRRANIWLDS